MDLKLECLKLRMLKIITVTRLSKDKCGLPTCSATEFNRAVSVFIRVVICGMCHLGHQSTLICGMSHHNSLDM